MKAVVQRVSAAAVSIVGDEAEPLYAAVCGMLGADRGVFGADMRVEIVGDGPVTILIDV